MIISRFSLTLVLLLTACEEHSVVDEPSVQPCDLRPSYNDPYFFEVFDGSRAIDQESLLELDEANPNKFEIDYGKRKLQVSGRVSKIPKFREETSEASAFRIPLHVFDPEQSMRRELAGCRDSLSLNKIRSASLNMNDFTLSKAAELESGQEIFVVCRGVRTFSNSLIFDLCEVDGDAE